MKIKRVIASFSRQIDDFVTQVENHEAVAECAIADVRQHTAKIHSQLNQVLGRVERFIQREIELEMQCEKWGVRATACGLENRAKALQCLQARKNTEIEIQQVARQKHSAETLLFELQEQLRHAEQALMELENRKANLSVRSAQNRITKTASIYAANSETTDSVFHRWEEKILADEYVPSGGSHELVGLEAQFSAEENREQLERTLDELLKYQSDQQGVEQ